MMNSSLGLLASLPAEERERRIRSLSPREAAQIVYDWDLWARPKQLPPPGEWVYWVLLAGRGFGKTLTAAQWIRRRVEREGAKHLILAGPTAGDIRAIMVDGESGLLGCCPPWCRPKYEPSKAELNWPNGAKARLVSAEEPDRFRGLQSDTIWCEELGSWKYPEAFDMMRLGFRLGAKYGVTPRAVISTTPKPIALIRQIVKDPDAIVVRGSTYENRANLPASFFSSIVRRYEGTRLGRQELLAHLLEDAEGALWKRDQIDLLRVVPDDQGKLPSLPDFRRVLVAVDPAVTDKIRSNETGVIVVAIGRNGHGYVLGDYSGRYSPDAWAKKVVWAVDQHKADGVVVEVNQGGDLAVSNIKTVRRALSVKKVHASRGKRTRAEPVAALYEQGRVHHVGSYPKLEDELCNWEPGQEGVAVSDPDDPSGEVVELSPDRMDALVWGLTTLMVDRDPDNNGGAGESAEGHTFEDQAVGL